MKKISIVFLLICSRICSGQSFSNFEYFFTTDPGVGNGTAITGYPNGSDITFNTNITVPANLNPGFHFLCVRTKTPSGSNTLLNRWSVAASVPIIINGGASSTGNGSVITNVEYFFDNDPGVGLATRVAFVNNGNDTAAPSFSATGVTPGFHLMGVRVGTGAGGWSVTQCSPVIVFPSVNTVSASQNQITHIEYFWGNDPGFGAGTNVSVSLTNESVIVPLTVPGNLAPGYYLLGVRARTGVAGWSNTHIQPFVVWSPTVNPGGQTGGQIVKLEYYIDADPGVGNGVSLTYTPNPGKDITSMSNLDIGALPAGNHVFYVRALDSYGQWSAPRSTVFSISCQNGVKLFTAQSGSWNDLSTWACGRIPLPTEDVYIKSPHKVTINLGQTGQCKTIDNGQGAILEVKTGAILRVN